MQAGLVGCILLGRFYSRIEQIWSRPQFARLSYLCRQPRVPIEEKERRENDEKECLVRVEPRPHPAIVNAAAVLSTRRICDTVTGWTTARTKSWLTK